MWIESNKTKKFGILTHLFFKHKEKPDSYTWHHLDDYNVETNTCILELVLSKAHDDGRPHAGACAQYNEIFGKKYR